MESSTSTQRDAGTRRLATSLRSIGRDGFGCRRPANDHRLDRDDRLDVRPDAQRAHHLRRIVQRRVGHHDARPGSRRQRMRQAHVAPDDRAEVGDGCVSRRKWCGSVPVVGIMPSSVAPYRRQLLHAQRISQPRAPARAPRASTRHRHVDARKHGTDIASCSVLSRSSSQTRVMGPLRRFAPGAALGPRRRAPRPPRPSLWRRPSPRARPRPRSAPQALALACRGALRLPLRGASLADLANRHPRRTHFARTSGSRRFAFGSRSACTAARKAQGPAARCAGGGEPEGVGLRQSEGRGRARGCAARRAAGARCEAASGPMTRAWPSGDAKRVTGCGSWCRRRGRS